MQDQHLSLGGGGAGTLEHIMEVMQDMSFSGGSGSSGSSGGGGGGVGRSKSSFIKSPRIWGEGVASCGAECVCTAFFIC